VEAPDPERHALAKSERQLALVGIGARDVHKYRLGLGVHRAGRRLALDR